MSEQTSFLVNGPEAGLTISAVVRGRLGDISWNKVRALCTSGRVLLDNQPAIDPAMRVRRGQSIEVGARSYVRKVDPKRIEILHADRDVVVVVKPADLLTVPYSGDERETLLHLTSVALRKREGASSPPLRVVQRLDKDTTGVVVFARNKASERVLGQQFRVHSVERRYLGIAYGRLSSSRKLSSMLLRDRGDGLRGSAPPGRTTQKNKDAKRAVTHLEPLQVFSVPAAGIVGGDSLEVTLVGCRLETGRQHQIRIHLSEQGHSLVGERVYCREYKGPYLRGFADAEGRPLLHAETLGFVHPRSDEPVRFECGPPADFSGLLERLARS